ncbi:hypothetical protein ACFRNT_11645 [Streptomyces sp. NPDC056697]|uniref:hypothetical protein n=1 Tax=Streptomyces sp. NPDC056697 TaxID=3345915 RepID=UPI00367C89D4
MPRVNVPVVQFSRAGTVIPAAQAGDPVNNHYVDNDGRIGIIVENTGSTVPRTVTFRLSRTVDGQAVTPRAETIPVGEQQGFGPFDVSEYGGKMKIDVDNAELKLTVVRI